MAIEEEQRNISANMRNRLGENITPLPPGTGDGSGGDDVGESEQNLLDLTNQPNGLILGDGFGYPLFSIENAYGYQFDVLNQRLQRLSTGVETLKYSADLAETSINHTYELSFNIKLAELPGNIGTEAKIEFQNGIDGNIGSTFFELPYDELINLNTTEYTTFTAQYTSPLEGQSIFFIKTTEVVFVIENLKIIDLGIVEEEEDDEVLTPGGSTEFVYWKACLCDSTSAKAYGSFKDDFEQWVEDGEYSDSEGFDLYAGGFTDGAPEGVYPSNCIGSFNAESQLGLYYDTAAIDVEIIHDPQLCVFGGMELNPDKENLIGLTWSDFAQAIESDNIFGLSPGLTEVEMQYMYFNKSGHSILDSTISAYNDVYTENEDLKIKLAYNFNAEKTNEYNPPLNFYNTAGLNYYNDVDWPYKSFSYTYNPNLDIDNPDGYEYQDVNNQDDVPPPTWEGEKYTTSENIYPIYGYGSNTPDVDDNIPVFVSGWEDELRAEVVDENNYGEIYTTVFPGKCPSQFIGEQDLNGKFGRQTLLGFGPTMCHDSHFDAIFESWLEDDDKSSPKIKPSQPTGNTTIETNPDANNVEIPIFANFPDNPTFNFIKNAFDEKMLEFFPESPYTKYLKINIKQENIQHFASVLYVDNNDILIDSFDFSGDNDTDIHLIVNLNDINEASVNEQIGGNTYKEQYGKILFTPAEALFDVEAQISYEVYHTFIPNNLAEQVYNNYYNGPTYDSDNESYPNGYDGVKFYNYGNMFENQFLVENGESWFNSHFTQLWTIASPNGDDLGEDRFEEAHYILQYNNNGSSTTTTRNEKYPNHYWSYEFDEQRGIQPANSYPNSWHWNNNYNLYYRYSGIDSSYWKYDNPTLSSIQEGFSVDDDLNIMQLFDYSFAEDWMNDDDDGGFTQNAQVLSHTPWPEQVIESWESDFKGYSNDILAKGNVFKAFNGKFGSGKMYDIYITGTIQYSGDFGVPGFDIDLNPSLDKSYDPYSGIDVRPEIIDENICQHIELMTRQDLGYGPDDGVFYKASLYPVDDDAVKAITCDTNINFNISPATKMRARCSDGSVVLMGDAGLGDTLNYPQDLFHYSGIDACTYASNHIRSYPNNQQFHFGADLDKRPSLGLFYYEEDNQASENFTGNIGNKFLQYPNTNLVTNPDGSVVDTYFEKTLFQEAGPTTPYTWSWFKPAGGWRPTSGEVNGYVDHIAYDDGGDWGNAGFDYFPKYFIQSDDFDSSLGFYRLTGWESFGGGPDKYEDWEQSDANANPRGRYFTGWIFENTKYTHKYHSTTAELDYGPYRKTYGTKADDGITDIFVGKHPYCHSAGKCLNFHLHPRLQDGVDMTTTPEEQYLNSVQQLLTKEEATQLFYHDTQSMPDLKVSFWMYTSSDGVEDLTNPHFPEIEVGVTKSDLVSGGAQTGLSLYGQINSLSNNDYIGASGRFKNTVLDEWERFEFTFNLYYDHFYNNNNKEFYPLFLSVQWSGYEIKDIHADTQEERYSKKAYGSVYLDDFSVKETGEFIPDVDVRAKKGEGNYSVGSLMEYYDPMIENQLESYNDTTAPLEAQFYFYARFFNEQVFDREEGLVDRFGDDATFRNELVANDFRRGRFYLYDVDFGDGSEKEFTDEPLRLGNNVAVYHTYTKSGIYEVTGYMLRTRPTKNEDGTPNHDEPVGVLHNKKFTIRINVNEGLDEDFEYFGSEDGFSYIPYKNISPVIGGISQESSYYKAIKRQLGFVGNECKQVEFLLRSQNGGDDQYYLAQDYPYFDDDVIPNFDGDLSNIGCDFDFYSIRDGGTPDNISDVSFIRALCGDGTYALIGDANPADTGNGRYVEMYESPDDDGNYGDFFHLTGNAACGGAKTSIFFEKESDKLKTEIALSKMDSSLNSKFEILPEFQISRYSDPPPTDGSEQGGELIYGGITTSEDELGKALGNVDLTNVRFFNEPKEIYQMFGFTCDNNLSDIDLIPLGKPEYGLNYSNHSRTFTDVNDIKSPYFTNVSKVANQTENGNLITDLNAIRFGHDFRIDNIEGLGSGQWNHIDNYFVDTSPFNTPDLGYNQTYTYSTHIYIPFGYCEDGRPCSAELNDYTAMCSECNGVQQYDEGNDFNVRIVQNMNDSEMGVNDWVHDLWHDDIVGGEWANVHDLPTSYGGGNETSFAYRQFDAFNHCHPKGVNNPRFKYGWSNGKVFPIRDGQYCGGLDYSACGLLNASGEADGCYWDGDENDGYCKAANLLFNQNPVNRTCWQATSEEQCEDGCEWYDGGSNNASFETAISTPHEDIITDEWFRLDFPFTAKDISDFGNHISLRFDTHLGRNRTTLNYPIISDDLVLSGDFTESEGPNLDADYLSNLPHPTCYEEFDIADPLDLVNALDAVKWVEPEVARPDIGQFLIPIVTGGLSDEEKVAALGGHCIETEIGGIIAMDVSTNQCVSDSSGGEWSSCEECYTNQDYNFYGPTNQTPLECCQSLEGLDETQFTEECEDEYQADFITSYKCLYYGEGTIRPIDTFTNPTAGPPAQVPNWQLYGNAYTDDNNLKILFNQPVTRASQIHVYDSTTNGKMYKLKYKVIQPTTEEDSKLLIVAREDGYVVGESIELPTDVGGNQEVMFTSDSIFTTGGGELQDATHPRYLIIGHSGGYNYGDSVIIDDVELYEVQELNINSTTKDEGLYTFGAQLLAGDFSGDNLINYTTEDLNPGDCADFEGGNPSNPRYWKNIIPSTYPFNYRDGISDDSLLRSENTWPTPALSDASDVWTYDTEDIEVLYKQNEDKLVNTVKPGASNGGDGEEIKITINGLYNHIAEDCDDYSSCVSLLNQDDLTQWYQLKFIYYGTEEDVGGDTNVSLKGVGIRMNRGSKIKADDWDRNTQGPKDGTTVASSSPGSTMNMWIYGDHGNEYQQEPHPDFWEQANCTVGEECTVWIFLLSSHNGNIPTSHTIQLLNGQQYDRTTWGNFSLIRADVALGVVKWEDLISRDMDYSSEQEWIGTNEYGNTYYYPVLPRFGLNGTFESANNQFYPGGDYDYPYDNIPFPIEGMVTEETSQEQSMIINIYNKQDEPNVFIDSSGNDNNAFAMNDYKPKYNEQTSEPQSIKNVDRIRTSKDKGAF